MLHNKTHLLLRGKHVINRVKDAGHVRNAQRKTAQPLAHQPQDRLHSHNNRNSRNNRKYSPRTLEIAKRR